MLNIRDLLDRRADGPASILPAVAAPSAIPALSAHPDIDPSQARMAAIPPTP